MYVVDLRTGERIEAPEEYKSAYLLPGERIGPNHIEALREAGEDPNVLEHLQMVGSPASYQPEPGGERISPDDPRFPWGKITEAMRPVEQGDNGEHLRGAVWDKKPITGPPNVYKNWWWPFCTYNSRTKEGNPRGVRWNPPVCCGYYGTRFVKGSNNVVYQWQCGGWGGYMGRYWYCPGYVYYKVDKRKWKYNYEPPKGYPVYRCR